MVAAKALRHQHLDRLAQQLLAVITEHPLGLRVDHLDQARRPIITIAFGADFDHLAKALASFVECKLTS